MPHQIQTLPLYIEHPLRSRSVFVRRSLFNKKRTETPKGRQPRQPAEPFLTLQSTSLRASVPGQVLSETCGHKHNHQHDRARIVMRHTS